MAIDIPKFTPTVKQQLKRIDYILELDNDKECTNLLLDFGMEALVPILSEHIRKLLKQIKANPELYTEALQPMKETRYRFLVIPGEKIPKDVKVKGSQLRKDRTLLEYIMDTIDKRPDLTSYFIVDDKSERYIGFVSYHQDEKTKTIVGIKIVRFDESGDLRKDIISLFDKLIEENDLIYWEAILDKDNPVIMPYKLYLERIKKLKGYETGYTETIRKDQKVAQYMVKTIT